MNVRCPSCQTTFRVDPDRISASGVKARCARCSSVFKLERSGAISAAVAGVGSAAGVAAATPGIAQPPVAEPRVAAAAPPTPPRPVVMPPPPPPQPMAPAATFVATPPAPPPVTPIPRPASAAPPAPAPVPTPAPAPAATAGVRRPSFRNQDPQARAQRIARALVSDIVAYNKDKLTTTLDAGTLRNEFREEIRKSWEEYVEQVGLDMAKSTPYFRDSLNEILAKGQKVF